MLKVLFILFLTVPLIFCETLPCNVDPDTLQSVWDSQNRGQVDQGFLDYLPSHCRDKMNRLYVLMTYIGYKREKEEERINGLIGKPCGSVLDCPATWLYCVSGKCGYKEPGVDCVGEGLVWNGGQSCCPPMANPQQKGMICTVYSGICSSDAECQKRHNSNKFRCKVGSDGFGYCNQFL